MSPRAIRVLTLPEIETLVSWAGGEGWNPGLADAQAFQSADPTGFLGAFVGDTMVSGISAVAYDANYGFIGLYICHPDWRGQGHGKAVWDAGMTYLGNRTIGLDGVPEQQANYASMGFVPTYESVRMSGTLHSLPAAAVVPVTPDLLPQLEALDRRCFPASRKDFLESWLAPPHQSVAFVGNGELQGYAVLRQCLDGQKLGPIFAKTAEVATTLIGAFTGPTQIDIPTDQVDFISQLTAKGFTPSFATARMYRSAIPAVERDKVFAVTSLELG
jgi:hypothetical protein